MALLRIMAVSVISTINVERPLARSSEEPIRVKIRSMGPMLRCLAGTKLPMWASRVMMAVWRMNVDLPPMLGPVIINRRRAGVRSTSFATNGPSSICSTTRCRPSTMWMPVSDCSSGRLSDKVRLRSAKQASTSSCARAVDVACRALNSTSRSSSRASYRCFSLFRARPRLLRALSSNSFRAGVMKRSAFFRVWRRM